VTKYLVLRVLMYLMLAVDIFVVAILGMQLSQATGERESQALLAACLIAAYAMVPCLVVLVVADIGDNTGKMLQDMESHKLDVCDRLELIERKLSDG